MRLAWANSRIAGSWPTDGLCDGLCEGVRTSTQREKAGRSAWTGVPDITLRHCRKSCNRPITRLQDPTGTGTGAEQAGERELVALPTSQLCALRSAVLAAPGCAASPAATLRAVFSGLGGSLGTLTLRPPRPRPLGALSAFSSREKGLSTAGFLAAGATTRLENALSGTLNPSILTLPELGREVPCSMGVFRCCTQLSEECRH